MMDNINTDVNLGERVNNHQHQKGTLVISLDFELYWGVRDKVALDDYRNSLLGAREVIPKMLDLFSKYNVHATWATVGLLFFSNRDAMMSGLPEVKPEYTNQIFSPYQSFDLVGHHEADDPFHYAASLIEQIKATPHQEIGTHTFSHYYCLERGQEAQAFEADLEASNQIASSQNINLESLVFPRNQWNPEYLEICQSKGISSFRGTEDSWLYQTHNEEQNPLWKKVLRFLDAHINLSGHHGHALEKLNSDILVNIPSSRYLRPFTNRLQFLEPFRLRRIKSSMTHVAKHNLIYHLWWHPHHLGGQPERSLQFLEQVFEHFQMLQNRYGMESLTMNEIAKNVLHKDQSGK